MAAALATIDEFERHDVVAHNHAIGRQLAAQCDREVQACGLDSVLQVLPCEWMVTFVCRDKAGDPSAGLRTLLMQEMIGRGVLFQGVFVPCYSHSREDVEQFAQAFGESLDVYARAVTEGYEQYLAGEPTRPVFRKTL
jgi:spore coat polysaccharide biosynthesis protein SpsF